MIVASIVLSSGKSVCRLGHSGCLVGYRGIIPEGLKVLKVSAAGCTSFYCEICMKEILDSFKKAISDSEKEIKDLVMGP